MCNFSYTPAKSIWLTFVNGLLCSYIYRRETTQKVTIFFKNSSKLLKNRDFYAVSLMGKAKKAEQTQPGLYANIVFEH
jgi:hypothetical protein